MTVTTGPSWLTAINRLAERVLGGEVVFFIGSGFSLDSESNSAERWVARLLARLLAMGTCLADDGANERSQARALLEGLGRVFQLDGATRATDARLQPVRCMTAANVKLLARDYYNFNEWVVSALGVLATEMVEPVKADRLAERMHRLENFLLRTLEKDDVPLERVEWPTLGGFAREATFGKALFLDTMGFASERVMAGAPRAAGLAQVAHSYDGRLRPRHHALARLAREGLAPFLVTTNYDLLLEGAYRLAGFVEQGTTVAAPDDLPPTGVPRFSRIAGAADFFTRGEGHRAALLLKIHGCVEAYREARQHYLDAMARSRATGEADGPSDNPWERYLSSIVFTYREIQTWRADAWSRDLVRTLLRTHTLALCGYSGADPVMHSTFRDVYEEMAQTRAAGPAAGGYQRSKLVDHPNQIEFDVGGGFPSLDDQFRWLTHRVLRETQRHALDSRLRRLAPRLLGHPCPDADYDALCDRFKALCDAEAALVAEAAGRRAAGRALDVVVGWTWHFLPGLLRELALAEVIEARQGPGTALRTARVWPWYFPASERMEWTAWAAVVELAVRGMIASWRGDPVEDASLAFEWLAAEESPHAAVSFARGGSERQPRAICLRIAGFERPGRPPALTGAFRRITYWELSEEDVPWRVEAAGHCPSARDVWKWARASTRASCSAPTRACGWPRTSTSIRRRSSSTRCSARWPSSSSCSSIWPTAPRRSPISSSATSTPRPMRDTCPCAIPRAARRRH